MIKKKTTTRKISDINQYGITQVVIRKISTHVCVSGEITYLNLAAGLGLEPRYSGPKPDVLPLDDPAIIVFYY